MYQVKNEEVLIQYLLAVMAVRPQYALCHDSLQVVFARYVLLVHVPS